jgi:hypothetical protein
MELLDITKPFHKLFLFHDGILAITKPSHELLFFTKEFWLSRSLSHEHFYTQWHSGYRETFSRISFSHYGILAIMKPFHEFLFHEGILAIKEPSTRTFLYTMEFWLSRSLFTNFIFTQWNSGYHEAFSRISLSRDGIHKMYDLGEDTFHIYHKEYLHRICVVKNLASLFRAPFVGKRVRSFLL